MKAKSNQPFPVQAFGGLRYVPNEWREVPKEYEDEARRNSYLILDEPARKAAEAELKAEAKAEAELVAELKAEAKAEAKAAEPTVKTPVSPTKPAAKKAAGK